MVFDWLYRHTLRNVNEDPSVTLGLRWIASQKPFARPYASSLTLIGEAMWQSQFADSIIPVPTIPGQNSILGALCPQPNHTP